MPTLKLNKLNRWLLIGAVSWILGFCITVGIFVLGGIVTIPAAYHMTLFIGMIVTGAPAMFLVALLLLPAVDGELSNELN